MELYNIEACRSLQGCPKSIGDCKKMKQLMEEVFVKLDFSSRRLRQLGGKFKQHHIFRVAIAGCANGCSQPQIKDFALIAKSLPRINKEKCISCGLCCQACREKGLNLAGESLVFVEERCLGCGDCRHVCPYGALTQGEIVWRLQLGGKLGRHPQLAQEIGEVNNQQGIVILEKALNVVLNAEDSQLRFGDLIKEHEFKI